MPLTTVLFDLDGTLLPMDQETFIHSYFKHLAVRLAPLGYEPQKLFDAIWTGMRAMIGNDGSCTNEKCFWDAFCTFFGKRVLQDKPVFDDFYRTDFQQVANDCGCDPRASKIITLCRSLGLRTILATNPVFPALATESRIRWAGLNQQDFELITTYENSSHCKPNYEDILRECKLSAEECLMVGNDAEEDGIAASLGMRVFLLTDCLINRQNKDLSLYPHGGFEDLAAYLQKTGA